ncbi:amino acid permease-domain-containing protein [Scleroderma yunnanense]
MSHHGPTNPTVALSYSETASLLQHAKSNRGYTHGSTSDGTLVECASATNETTSRRRLGLLSAVSLIFNRIIGTSVFAAPSIVLKSSGSIGLSFVMWIIGASVSAAGTAVYIEFGTGLPRNGGEKTYLEYIYRRPQFFITCLYAAYAVLLGQISSASVAFGEYALHAIGFPLTATNARVVAWLVISLCFIIHGIFPRFGVKLQNTLGVFKLGILLLISVSGFFCMFGIPGFLVDKQYDQPHNFKWATFWEGSNVNASAFVNGIYIVIWSFVGYSNANYALSEVRDPVRTIKRAAPIALLLVTSVYIFVNIAYYAVVSKTDILNSGTIVAALFFRNLFGSATEQFLSAVIALSIFGNILAVSFAQGRVNQELGREGVLPYSRLLASNEPFDAPFFGLLIHYSVSTLTVLLAPPGDAYNFIVNYLAYPCSIINLLVSGGLLLLHSRPYKPYNWDPPYRVPTCLAIFFFLSNVFLLVVPLIPPSAGYEPYEHLPYYSHIVMALSIGLVGVIYWLICFDWMPRIKGYRLVQEVVLDNNGPSYKVFRRIPIQ